MLATALACELERGLAGSSSSGGSTVALILVDGAPAAPPPPPPAQPPSGGGGGWSSGQLAAALYARGLFGLCVDAGVPPQLLARAGGGVEGAWRVFSAEFAREVDAAEAAAREYARVEEEDEEDEEAGGPSPAEQAFRQLAVRYRPLSGAVPPAAWEARVARALAACALSARLAEGYSPQYVLQGPAVLVLTEDEEGRALLNIARECCCGPLSLLPPDGLGQGGEGLATAEGHRAVASLLGEALAELLSMV
jgi:hypothetical protein